MEVSYSSDSGEVTGSRIEQESPKAPQSSRRNITPSWLSNSSLAPANSAAVAGAMKALHTRITALELSNSDLIQELEEKQCKCLLQKDELLSESLGDQSEKSSRIAGLEYRSELLESEILTVEAKESAWEEVIAALETTLERVSMVTADAASAQSAKETRLLETLEEIVLKVDEKTETLNSLEKEVKEQEEDLEALETVNANMRRAVEEAKRDISGVKSANEELDRVLGEEIERKEKEFVLKVAGLKAAEYELSQLQTELENKNDALQEQIAGYKSEIEKAKRAPTVSVMRNVNDTRNLTLRIPELPQVSIREKDHQEQGTAEKVASKISALGQEIRVLGDNYKKMLHQVNSSSAIEATSSAVNSLTSALEEKSRDLLALKRKQQELIRSQVLFAL